MSLVTLPALLLAGRTAVSQAQASKGCTATEYREFDFWLGEWEVYAASGTLAGGNSIRSDWDGRDRGAVDRHRGIQRRQLQHLQSGDAEMAPDVGRQQRNAAAPRRSLPR